MSRISVTDLDPDLSGYEGVDTVIGAHTSAADGSVGSVQAIVRGPALQLEGYEARIQVQEGEQQIVIDVNAAVDAELNSGELILQGNETRTTMVHRKLREALKLHRSQQVMSGDKPRRRLDLTQPLNTAGVDSDATSQKIAASGMLAVPGQPLTLPSDPYASLRIEGLGAEPFAPQCALVSHESFGGLYAMLEYHWAVKVASEAIVLYRDLRAGEVDGAVISALLRMEGGGATLRLGGTVEEAVADVGQNILAACQIHTFGVFQQFMFILQE